MKRCLTSLLILLLLLPVGPATSVAAEPEMRPALVGDGPHALINVINVNRLVKKGQGDGLLMFTAYVSVSGHVLNYSAYRATPDSDALQEEVKNALPVCRFLPAIYHGRRVDVYFGGTVLFTVTDGKPHLRVYANQNRQDIQEENDFIAPQLVAGSFTWAGISRDPGLLKARAYHQRGAMQFSLTIDANGNVNAVKTVAEDPPGFGFGAAYEKIYAGAKWIPGFRNGQPVDSTFDYTDYFR